MDKLAIAKFRLELQDRINDGYWMENELNKLWNKYSDDLEFIVIQGSYKSELREGGDRLQGWDRGERYWTPQGTAVNRRYLERCLGILETRTSSSDVLRKSGTTNEDGWGDIKVCS